MLEAILFYYLSFPFVERFHAQPNFGLPVFTGSVVGWVFSITCSAASANMIVPGQPSHALLFFARVFIALDIASLSSCRDMTGSRRSVVGWVYSGTGFFAAGKSGLLLPHAMLR